MQPSGWANFVSFAVKKLNKRQQAKRAAHVKQLP